jgi:hypothetical protein
MSCEITMCQMESASSTSRDSILDIIPVQYRPKSFDLSCTSAASFTQQCRALGFDYDSTKDGPNFFMFVWLIGSFFICSTSSCLAGTCMFNCHCHCHWASNSESAPIASCWIYCLNLLGNAATAVGYVNASRQFAAALYNIQALDQLSFRTNVGIALVGVAVIEVLHIDIQGSVNAANTVLSLGSLLVVCAILVNSNRAKQPRL